MIILPDIIGLPPGFSHTADGGLPEGGGTTDIDMNQLIRDSMPLLEIRPAMPELSKGMQGFTMAKTPTGKRDFVKELEEFYEIKMRSDMLRVAFMSNNPPTETFNNDYGESLLEGIANVASSGVRDMSFMTGGMDPSEMLKALSKKAALKEGESFGDDAAGKALEKAAGITSSILNSASGGVKNIENISQTAKGLMMGNKLDFPLVWKNTSFSPNYSVSIKLYNPYPGDEKATLQLITAPLMALLMFVTPYSEDGNTFSWPWCCIFHIPGLVQWSPGYIKSISVVKGGNDNLIAFNQRPSLVEINMDIGLLYTSMLHTKKKTSGSDIPNLSKYGREFSDELTKQINPDAYLQNGVGPTIRPGKTALMPSSYPDEGRSVTERVVQKVQDATGALKDFQTG